MTKEQIVGLAVENNLVAEVYDILHYIVISELGALQDKSNRVNSELRLIKKFADVNKLDVIKDILAESEDEVWNYMIFNYRLLENG